MSIAGEEDGKREQASQEDTRRAQKCGQAAAVCGACLCDFTLRDSGCEFTESGTLLGTVPRALWEAPQRLN